MAPKLYMVPPSPPVRAVLMCEKALGIELEHINVDLASQGHLKPEFVKMNPQHTVPTFVDTDGTSIWDSHAIMAYLVGKYGKNDSLYPKNLAKRALVDQRLHFESGNVFPVLKSIGKNIREKKAVTDEDKALLVAAYEFLDAFLKDNLWVAGNEVTIADFSLIASIITTQQIIPVDAKYDNVHEWLKRAEALPYYDVNNEGLEMIKAMLK